MTELFTTVQNSSDEELLPCPFCGGKASYKGMEYGRNWITCQVVCLECESSTKRVTELTWKDAEDEVRELWNRRAEE